MKLRDGGNVIRLIEETREIDEVRSGQETGEEKEVEESGVQHR